MLPEKNSANRRLDNPLDLVELRRQAEARLEESQRGDASRSGSKEESELQIEKLGLARDGGEGGGGDEPGPYTDLYDFAPVGYFILGPDGMIRQVNLSGARLLGLERAWLVGRRFGLFVADADRSVFNAFLKQVFESQAKAACELALRTPYTHGASEGAGEEPMGSATFSAGGAAGETDQRLVWLEAVAAEDGQTCRAVVLDISERKQAEAALRESESKFRALFQNNHAVMLFIDPETGDIIEANPAASAYYGWSLEELCSKQIIEINTLSEAEVKMEMQKAMAEKRNYFQFHHRLANGQIRAVEVYSGPIQHAGRKLLYSIVHDITSRKQAEDALLKSEETYRSLFENMLNGVAYCRMVFENNNPQDFLYIEVNKAFEETTGLKNVTGRWVSEVIPGIREADPGLFEIYGRVALTGKPEKFEQYVESLNDWYSISVYSPKREYFVAVFDVVTERKKTDAQIQEQLTELRRWYAVTMGREDRIIELKREVNELLAEAGKPTRYASVLEQPAQK